MFQWVAQVVIASVGSATQVNRPQRNRFVGEFLNLEVGVKRRRQRRRSRWASHLVISGALCCAVKDACSNRIVGHAIAEKMTSQLTADALTHAVTLRQRPAPWCIPIAGASQFRSTTLMQTLRRHGLHGSTGRVEACAETPRSDFSSALLQ